MKSLLGPSALDHAPPGLPLPEIEVRQKQYLGASQATIVQTEENARLLKAKALPPQQVVAGMRAPASYFYDLSSHDEIAYARRLGKLILILHGTRDYQVVEDDIEVWRTGLSHISNVTIEELPDLNHLFIAGSGKPSPDEYFVASYVAPEVTAKLAAFVKQ